MSKLELNTSGLEEVLAMANALPDAEGGSGALIVTIDEETGNASHTSAEIYAHVQSGGKAVWYFEYMATYVSLNACDEAMAVFVFNNGEENAIYHLAIYDDGSFDTFDNSYAEWDSVIAELNEKITRPPGAKVGQTIVVRDVNDQGYPTAWTYVDLPVVARFSGQSWDIISCESNTVQELHTAFEQKCPVIAHIIITQQGEPPAYITAVCHQEPDGTIVVYDGLSMFEWANSEDSNVFYVR